MALMEQIHQSYKKSEAMADVIRLLVREGFEQSALTQDRFLNVVDEALEQSRTADAKSRLLAKTMKNEKSLLPQLQQLANEQEKIENGLEKLQSALVQSVNKADMPDIETQLNDLSGSLEHYSMNDVDLEKVIGSQDIPPLPNQNREEISLNTPEHKKSVLRLAAFVVLGFVVGAGAWIFTQSASSGAEETTVVDQSFQIGDEDDTYDDSADESAEAALPSDMLPLNITDTGYYVVKDDMLPVAYYAVEVENPNEDYAVNMQELEVTLFAKDGHVAGTSYSYIPTLEPGQTVVVTDMVFLDEDPDATLEFSLDKPDEFDYTMASWEEIRTEKFEIFNTHVNDDGTNVKVTGQVSNVSDSSIGYSHLYVVFKKDGKLLGGYNTLINAMDPGESKAFELSLDSPGDFDEVEYYCLES